MPSLTFSLESTRTAEFYQKYYSLIYRLNMMSNQWLLGRMVDTNYSEIHVEACLIVYLLRKEEVEFTCNRNKLIKDWITNARTN